jgi:hypothetical protein
LGVKDSQTFGSSRETRKGFVALSARVMEFGEQLAITTKMPGMLSRVQETGLLVFLPGWYTCRELDGIAYVARGVFYAQEYILLYNPYLLRERSTSFGYFVYNGDCRCCNPLE